MTTFYDTHAHLDYPQFASDLSEVVQKAEAAGVARVISIGTDLASSARAVALAERFPNVFAAVGWHPVHALEAPEDLRPALRALGRHPKVVAIGETGLDYFHLPSREKGGLAEDDERLKRRQADIFQQQLEVAAELGLNCVVHQRESFEDALAMVRPLAGQVRAQFHCFANDPSALESILAIGSLVSFTGILTYKNAQNVRQALAAAPLRQFMLETDCPYLPPAPRPRSQRCEPAYVREIAETAARVKGCSLEDLSQATCAAAHEFFPKLK